MRQRILVRQQPGTSWWWVGTVILAGFLVLSLVQPQRMKRRLRALDTRQTRVHICRVNRAVSGRVGRG